MQKQSSAPIFVSLANYKINDQMLFNRIMMLDKEDREILVDRVIEDGYNGEDLALIMEVLSDIFQNNGVDSVFHDDDPESATSRSILLLERWADAVMYKKA
jgi:hypothetical protein